MRSIATAAGTILIVMLSYGGAQAAPWCAYYGGHGGGGGGTNCGFYSFAQCMAAVTGTGGFCNRNPFESGSDNRRRYRRD
jgi:hypothetical protein